MFPGVSTVADTNRTYPLGQTGVQMLGYVGQISSPQLQAHQRRGLPAGRPLRTERAREPVPGVPAGTARHRQGRGERPRARWWGAWVRRQPTSGDDVVTNIDSGLEQTLQQAPRRRGSPSRQGEVHRRCRRRARPPDRRRARPGVRPRPMTRRGGPTGSPPPTSTSSSPRAPRTTTPSRASTPRGPRSSSPPPPPRCRPVSSRRASPSTTPAPTPSPGARRAGRDASRYHDNEGEVGGTINVSQALTVSSDIFFYNLGVQFWNDYKAPQYGETPIQDAAAQLGYGDDDRDRPAQRDTTSPGSTRPRW